jgi:hypothetical protein
MFKKGIFCATLIIIIAVCGPAEVSSEIIPGGTDLSEGKAMDYSARSSQEVPRNDVVATVSQVRCYKDGEQISVCTGFFYLYEGAAFFITNRHAVLDEKEDYVPDTIKLKLHTDASDLSANEDFLIELYGDNGERIWLEHPKYKKNVDIVAIPVEVDLFKTKYVHKAFMPSSHIPDEVFLPVGGDVLVLGYPLGFSDSKNNLPIVRDATLASVYPVPFEGMPVFLIDGRLHSGMSGSPVITKPSNFIQKKDGDLSVYNVPQVYLLGVHSAKYDVSSRDPDKDEPLGLNEVWFASLIPEIVEQ